MLEIFIHQLQDNLKSLRFQAGVVALLLFFGANGTVYMLKADRVNREVQRLESENASRYDHVTNLPAAVDNDYRFLLRPLGTEFIAEGGAHWFEDTGLVNPATGQGIGYTTRRAALNNWMDSFEPLDWVLIVRVVLSFLALVLAYDAFSGERETGTLALVLVNPISRIDLLVAKFGAHLASLFTALLLGVIVSLTMLSVTKAVHIDTSVVAAVALFLVGSVFYCSLFLLVSLGVSALSRTSASSLVFLVLIWAVIIVALPQAAYLIGVRTVQSPDWNQLDDREEQIASSLANEGTILRGREEGRVDGYLLERRWAKRMNEEEKVRRQMYRAFHDLEVRQYEVTSGIAVLSPGYAFQYAVEAALGTGIIRHKSFSLAVREYVTTLRDFIRARDAADEESPHILFIGDYMSQQSIDPTDIPRFPGVRLSFGEGVTRGWFAICLLILEALASFFFASWAAVRSPVVDRA